jgi:protein involved in polysaccharide export with SLBB domain
MSEMRDGDRERRMDEDDDTLDPNGERDRRDRVHQPMMGESGPVLDAMRNFVGPLDMLDSNVFLPTPERYQLGPGDVLILRYSGRTVDMVEREIRVDERGALVAPTGRTIVVRGLTLDAAQNLVQRELNRDLNNVTVTLTLRELRTMTIVVMGEAYRPGSYQVPAVMTLFNALYVFGGPTEAGSLRNIELRRNDGTLHRFDFYQFILFGDASQDVPLQPGDVIFLPPAGPRVAVRGEVVREAVYEIDAPDRLRTVLRYAGGAKPTGVTQRVSLESVVPGQERKLFDVDLNSTAPEDNPPVFNGDLIEIFSIRPLIVNEVTLEGAVDQPGRYAWFEGMTVADLVDRARGPIREAYLVRANLYRINPDNTTTLIPISLFDALQREAAANVQVQPLDRLLVFRTEEVLWIGDRRVEVAGSVRRPNTYYRADNMRVLDLVLEAGGLEPEAFREGVLLKRLNPDGTEGPMIRIDLNRAAIGDDAHNILLQDRDVLMVQSVQEAMFVPDQVVRILGAVQRPGEYRYASNLRISDLIQLAGGVKPNADSVIEVARARVPRGTPVERITTRDERGTPTTDLELQPGDVVTIAERSDILLKPIAVTIVGAVERPGVYTISGQGDRIAELVARAGGFTRDAFPKGAQYSREPQLLTSQSQRIVGADVQRLFAQIAEEEYRRAVGRSDVEKLRVISETSTAGVPSILPTGAEATATPQIPVEGVEAILRRTTVTPARPLTEDDLIPAGNLNIDLQDAIQRPNGPNNIEVKAGDIIIVPQLPTTVNVIGAVVRASSVLYVRGRSIDYYIDLSGGYAPDAAPDRLIVIRSNGSIERMRRGIRIELGDTIFVPTKVMADRLTDRQGQLDRTIRTVSNAALSIAIIRALVR